MPRTAKRTVMPRTAKRIVMKTDGVTPLTDQQICAVLKETFWNRKPPPDYDLVLLSQDLARVLKPLTRIAEDRRLPPKVSNIRKNLRNALLKIENTPKNRLILNAVGRNSAGREKDMGIKVRDMRSY